MKRIVVDVDTQHDFVAGGGSLYIPAEPSVPEAITRVLAQAQENGHPIVGSVDSHAYDAWEFADNGGPFATHCVKGTRGWLRVNSTLPAKTRFIPMQAAHDEVRNLVGERVQGEGDRTQSAGDLAIEAIDAVGLYFEKEVYSLFRNPTAGPVLAALVQRLGGRRAVRFDVIGYCTGGYCVDAAARGLAERGYAVRVLGYATAPIGGADGEAKSRTELEALGVQWVDQP